jgi:hypothetical protein
MTFFGGSEIGVLFLLIILFTLVQSVFGVGLLVFGTPTLILLGFSFTESLTYLLPPSITISVFQVYSGWNKITLYKFNVIIYILPMVVIGLLITIFYSGINLHLIIGLILLLTSIIRFSDELNKVIERFFNKNFVLGFIITGVIHGLTNLGGATLAIITNGIYKDKMEIQPNIAYAYLFMAIIQIIILILMGEFIFSEVVLFLPFISGITYLIVGHYIFEKFTNHFYYTLMTFFMFLYGLVLVMNSYFNFNN